MVLKLALKRIAYYILLAYVHGGKYYYFAVSEVTSETVKACEGPRDHGVPSATVTGN